MRINRSAPVLFLISLLTLIPSGRAQTMSANGVSGSNDNANLINQPKADYQARRRSLMQQVKELEAKRTQQRSNPNRPNDFTYEPIIVLIGQDEGDIGEGKYRQKNHFAYLTGVETPSAYAILLPNQDRETLYIPPRDLANERWTGVQLGPGPEAEAKLGFQHVASTEKFHGDLFDAIGDPEKPMRQRKRVAVVYTISPEGHSALVTREYQFVHFIKEGAPSTEVKDVSLIIDEMRKAKSDGEITLVQKAIDITGIAQSEVSKMIKPGVYEYQIEGRIADAFISNGAERMGFPSIVGSGINSTTLHYSENQKKVDDGDLVVVDIGAEYKYYTADITRTYPANGKFTSRQREVYQLVLNAQTACAAAMKPGETHLRDMTAWTRNYLKQSPLRAKDENGVEHTMDYFFIHGLGHYMGMDVHDVGDYTKPLQVGEIFTIEPGIYIPSEALGVRIEDDYIMTANGPQKLSKNIPSEPDEIERLIAQGRGLKPNPAGSERKKGSN